MEMTKTLDANARSALNDSDDDGLMIISCCLSTLT